MINEFDRLLFADLKDENDSQRMRARLEHRRRVVTAPRNENAAGSRTRRGPSPRSLPSGPAPNWTGFALALLLLLAACIALAVVLGLWILAAPLRWVGNLIKRAGG